MPSSSPFQIPVMSRIRAVTPALRSARPSAASVTPSHSGALGFKRPSALHRTMAVTVGFHHRADSDGIADVPLDRVKILSQRGQGNFRPRTAIKNQRAAVG